MNMYRHPYRTHRRSLAHHSAPYYGGRAVLFLGLLLFSFLVNSCVREEEYANTPHGNFEALWTIIDEHYCFLDYKHKTIGLDWNTVHTTYSTRLRNDMKDAQLFEVLSDMLSELRDGHVNLYAAHDVGRNWSWHEDFPSNYSEELQDAYLGTDYKIAASLCYRILDDNIGYVVCRSFSSSFGEGNLDEVFHALRTCDGLILDVRDNSGGDLTNAERLAQRFTNERRLVGYISHKTGKGHNDFSTPEEQHLNPSDGVRWQKRAIVLTNRRCYSATNTFVRDVSQCPLVTTLGDQTGGGSGLPMTSELPKGWLVRFSACPMYDAQMQQIEFGIKPDTLVTLTEEDRLRGKDTLIETARAMLRKQ